MSGTTTAIVVDQADAAGATREAVERHGGHLVPSPEGTVAAAFSSSLEAIAAATELQQAAGPGAGVRVGVHVGEGDHVVATAAGLCRSAAAGEILVSDLVQRMIGGGDLTFGPGRAVGVSDPALDAAPLLWEPRAERRIRAIVADDAALIRAGIVRLLTEAGFDVVADVADADALLAAVEAHRPDLVITDIRMPPTNTDEGLRAAAAIRSSHPATAVLVLSQHIEARAAAGLLDGRPAGIGYLLKERVSELAEFIAATRAVVAGGSVIDPLVAEQMLGQRRHDDALARLTEREGEVLALMAEGRSNAAISEGLRLSPKTVETHVRSIFTKLDLGEDPDGHRRVQAVVRWLQAPA
jgi:DNA-binding NarL/FixJ family response regulator